MPPPPPTSLAWQLTKLSLCLSLELFVSFCWGRGFAYIFTVQLAGLDEGGVIIPKQRKSVGLFSVILATAYVQTKDKAHKVHTPTYVPSSELGPHHPLPPPLPAWVSPPGTTGGVYTFACEWRSEGGPNSDDWRKSLVLCLLCDMACQAKNTNFSSFPRFSV